MSIKNMFEGTVLETCTLRDKTSNTLYRLYQGDTVAYKDTGAGKDVKIIAHVVRDTLGVSKLDKYEFWMPRTNIAVHERTEKIEEKTNDPVNHPVHYTSHPSGIECIQITRHMSFNLGNALKYIWRADLKNGIEDLEKAAWYIKDEIERRKKVEQQ